MGRSIKDIALNLDVSVSSVSVWCRDIKLSHLHIKKLEEKIKKGSYKGRKRGAEKIEKRRKLR